MGFFRSEDMSLYEITVPKDNCWDIMNELGNLNNMHFIDLNKDEQVFNLQYAPFIKRCEETEKKIEFIEIECKRHGVPMNPPKSVDDFLNKLNTMRRIKKKSNNLFFEEIEKDIDAKEKFVQEQTRKEKDIFDCLVMFHEYLRVLRLAKFMLVNNDRRSSFGLPKPEGNENATKRSESQEELLNTGIIKVSNIIGTIDMIEKERFKKLVFRATRGNALTHFKDFEKPVVDYFGNSVMKTVYVVMFPEGEAIREKLTRLCDSFLGEKYEIPTGSIDDKIVEIKGKIAETKQIITVTKEEIRKYLTSINAFEESKVSSIQIYKWFIRKEKCLYSTLNKFKNGNRLLIGLFWLPNSKKDELNKKIMDIKEDRNISGPQIWRRDNHNVTPPSYFKLNEFTWAFQEITNTYGVPNYKEVNPSVFGIVTFPFLFGVMFGDIGHGFLLFLFGVFACLAADKLRDGPLDALAQARYLVLLMGFFATFNGICYNDFMSLPVEGGTCYNIISHGKEEEAVLTDDCVYGIGVDPTWYLASNDLNYINAFKMKMSVIFGVAQMTLGIFMKSFNAIHFGRMVDLFFEFIPQLFLLMCLFGFMDLLIIVKWLTDWKGQEGKAPSIISIMINMFLNQGKVDEEVALPLIGSASTQQSICILLLLIALICVPTMLLVKPIYLNCTKSKHVRQGSIGHRFTQLDDEEEKDGGFHTALNSSMKNTMSKADEEIDLDAILENQGGNDESHSFGEMFIHQLIETIEFALGTVSNTASYLRLWALSLAHSQLAHVFYEKLLGDLALSKGGNFFMVFLLFPAFFSFTLFVLLCMDVMECFLHTLRLHWVEFQNKFYKGNGYLFNPFSFEKELKQVK